MNADHRLVRSAGAMGVMTLLSRVFGYLRDLLLASVLGAAGSSDAFIIALRIPNLLRRLVGEGAFTAAFVPVLARRLQGDERADAERLVGRTFGTLATVLAGIVVTGTLLSPWVVRVVAWGFQQSPEKWNLTVALNRVMFPYLLFIGLAALVMAALNALNSFAVPAFTPVLLNASIITSALVLAPRFPEPAFAFAIGVLVGGLLQLSFQLPFLARRGLRLRPAVSFRDPDVRRVAWLMLPGLFGVAVYQINLVVDAQFASFLGDGSVSWLYYADRITELVLGVFAISLSTVVLPTLSRQVAAGDQNGARDTVSLALRLVAFVTIPSSIGLVMLRVPIVSVLFEHGAFGADDAARTADALAAYGVGLLPFSAVKVLAPTFYAHQDTRTPVKVATLVLAAHVALCALLVVPMRHSGIALATSLSAALNAGLLLLLIHRRMGTGFLERRIFTAAVQFLACGLVMAGSLAGFSAWRPFPASGGAAAVGWLLAAILGGAVIYVATHLAMGGREVRDLRGLLPWRGGGRGGAS